MGRTSGVGCSDCRATCTGSGHAGQVLHAMQGGWTLTLRAPNPLNRRSANPPPHARVLRPAHLNHPHPSARIRQHNQESRHSVRSTLTVIGAVRRMLCTTPDIRYPHSPSLSRTLPPTRLLSPQTRFHWPAIAQQQHGRRRALSRLPPPAHAPSLERPTDFPAVRPQLACHRAACRCRNGILGTTK